MSLMDAFKKKDASSDVPDVSEMLKSGMSEQDIIDSLRQQGYDSTSIKDALVRATTANDDAAEQTTGQNTRAPQPSQTPQDQFAMEEPEPSPPPQHFSLPPIKFSTPSSGKGGSSTGMSDQALDTIQQVLEQIIEEKWQAAASDIAAIKSGLKSTNSNVDMIDQKIEKLGQRIDGIQNVMLGKTEDYNKTMSDVNIELQAFEKVIDRLVPTISDSIKELRDLVDEMKHTKS